MRTPMLRSALLLAVLSLSFIGCMGTSKYSQRPEVVYKEDLLRETAAFDLSCKAEELEVIQLGHTLGAGVAGCGKKARYVFDGDRQLWLANMKNSRD
jgi:hypothetical protein